MQKGRKRGCRDAQQKMAICCGEILIPLAVGMVRLIPQALDQFQWVYNWSNYCL